MVRVIDPGDWGLGGVDPTIDKRTTLGVGNGTFFIIFKDGKMRVNSLAIANNLTYA